MSLVAGAERPTLLSPETSPMESLWGYFCYYLLPLRCSWCILSGGTLRTRSLAHASCTWRLGGAGGCSESFCCTKLLQHLQQESRAAQKIQVSSPRREAEEDHGVPVASLCIPCEDRSWVRGGSRGCSGHTGVFLCLRLWDFAVCRGSLGQWGVRRTQCSHGWTRARPPHAAGQGGTGRAPLCSFRTHSGMDAGVGVGEQPVAGQAGVSFVGLQSHVLNFPSSLLPLHLTHADPPSPPGSPHSHEPQHSFCDWTGKYS